MICPACQIRPSNVVESCSSLVEPQPDRALFRAFPELSFELRNSKSVSNTTENFGSSLSWKSLMRIMSEIFRLANTLPSHLYLAAEPSKLYRCFFSRKLATSEIVIFSTSLQLFLSCHSNFWQTISKSRKLQDPIQGK